MSYYKLVKDLVEKISKNSSSSTRFILLIFSTRYFNSKLKDTCGLFFEMFNFDGLLGCPFENRSYAGFAEAANAVFKSFKPS